MSVPDSSVQHAYRLRVSLFVLAVLLAIPVLVVGSQAIYTLRVLEAVERDRDRWQRAGEILEPLQLKDGSVVADIGCGAGYFTLKLAPMVGRKGTVFAEDVLREPLAFLWIRARLRHQGRVHVMHGDPDNPHLPEGRVDAVLIVNTYHEFTHPRAVLSCAYRALRRGGRIVIADRGPPPDGNEAHEPDPRRHEVAPGAALSDLRATGFEEISRNDRFISDRPDSHPWWLLVARKP